MSLYFRLSELPKVIIDRQKVLAHCVVIYSSADLSVYMAVIEMALLNLDYSVLS